MMAHPYYGVRIEAQGLDETIKALREIDRTLPREFKRGLKEDAKPILDAARGYASGIARTGGYAGSFSMRSYANGIYIASSDPGAGTIEFAHSGAVYLSGKRRGLRVGVPRGNPPRALVKASLENEDYVAERIESRIESVIERYLNG